MVKGVAPTSVTSRPATAPRPAHSLPSPPLYPSTPIPLPLLPHLVLPSRFFGFILLFGQAKKLKSKRRAWKLQLLKKKQLHMHSFRKKSEIRA